MGSLAEQWTATDTAASAISCRSASSPSDWRRSAKRFFDVTLTVVGLVIALPLMAVVALAIKVSEGGPVLFRQSRVGRHGALFTIFKFRTMEIDAEAKLATLLAQNEREHLFKIERDPRITSIGRILRRLSLDELPQLFNVLNGTMSLVGPRRTSGRRNRPDAARGETPLGSHPGHHRIVADQRSIRLGRRRLDRPRPALRRRLVSAVGRTHPAGHDRRRHHGSRRVLIEDGMSS